MSKRMSNSKYFKAYMMINNWFYFYNDLTSTEAEKMLLQTDLNEDQIPSRTRIHEMIGKQKKVYIKPKSKRYQRTEEIKKRNYLLSLLAKEE